MTVGNNDRHRNLIRNHSRLHHLITLLINLNSHHPNANLVRQTLRRLNHSSDRRGLVNLNHFNGSPLRRFRLKVKVLERKGRRPVKGLTN